MERSDVDGMGRKSERQTWKTILGDEVKKPYYRELMEQVEEAYRTTTVYPPRDQLFDAFRLTPFDRVKVVIIGQDPYHGPGQAMGLSFSVPHGVPIPPSLRNIYREIESDLGLRAPLSGDLTDWARQGVLLLNASLSVEAHSPMSHARLGWQKLTDCVIEQLSRHREHLVFLLWGRFAQQKAELIDASRHLILRASHPSPLSASRGFFGCRHFSKTNYYLFNNGIEPIQWIR